ncbi:MAG: hypothetical protein KF901_28525 [Myxococcales bacterium]|nr:hypothetical protein [Myxococcales bacterium]
MGGFEELPRTAHAARRRFRQCAAEHLDALGLELEAERDIICGCSTASCVAEHLDRQRARGSLEEGSSDPQGVAELRSQIDGCLMARAIDSDAYVELARRSAEELCGCTTAECVRRALAARDDAVAGRVYVAPEARDTAGPYDARACDCVNRLARDEVADPGALSLVMAVLSGEVTPHRSPRYELAGALRCAAGSGTSPPARCNPVVRHAAPIEARGLALVVPHTSFRWPVPSAWRAFGQFSGDAEWRAVRGECGARTAVLLRVSDEARDVREHMVDDWSIAHTLASCASVPPTSLSLASSQLTYQPNAMRFESTYVHEGESYRVSIVRVEGSCRRVVHQIVVSRGGPWLDG